MRSLRAPFFEIGPKNHLQRPALIRLAAAAERIGVDQGVDIVMTTPVLDCEAVKRAAPGLLVFSQTVDPAPVGDSTGAVLPESLARAGVDGVILNHPERPLPPRVVPALIERCRRNGLVTLVCAADAAEAVRVARQSPDIILLEPPALIGTAHTGDRPWIPTVNAAVAAIDPAVLMMHAGGVSTPAVAEAIMSAGAHGTGATSAIIKASDPVAATAALVAAARSGWQAARAAGNRWHPPICSASPAETFERNTP